MRMRPILVTLAVMSVSMWLMSQYEESQATGQETTTMQELAVGEEATAVGHTASTTQGSWIKTYPLEGQHYTPHFLLASDGTVLLLEGWRLTKVDEYGEVVWSNSYNLSHWSLKSAIETPDGFILGVSDLGGWSMVKVDDTGQILWAKKYNGPGFSFSPDSIIQTDDLGYLTGGAFSYSCSHSGCALGYWLAKLDANGAVVWAEYYESSRNGIESFLQMDDDAFLVLYNGIVAKIASDGSVLWSKSYNIDSGFSGEETISFDEAHTTMDGGLLLTGMHIRSYPYPGGYDGTCLLMKLDVDGDVEWIRGYEAEESGAANRRTMAKATADGGYVVTCGKEYYAEDETHAGFALLKLDEAGSILWQQRIEGDNQEIPAMVEETADHAFLIGGRSNSFSSDADVTLWRVRTDDDLCDCPFFNEGSFFTVDDLLVTPEDSPFTSITITFSVSPSPIEVQPETAVSQVVCAAVVRDKVTAVIPTSGGTVTASDGHVSLLFPSGSFSETVQVTYRHFWDDMNTGQLVGLGERMEVTAVYSATQQPAQLMPGASFTATIHYIDDSPVIEDTLAWYQWQESGWQMIPGSQLSLPDQTITAVIAQLGQIAVLGETHQVYFPIGPHGSNSKGYRLFLNLNEAGDHFSDLSGYSHDGECDGESCPIPEMGVSQMARHFDGMDDVIQLGNPLTLNLRDEVTIAAWVKPETAVGLQNIIAHGYALNPSAELFLRLNNGVYEIGSWNGSDHKTGFPIPAEDIGQWVHLVGVFDGTTWRLYRNGVEVSSDIDDMGAVPVYGRWAVGATGNSDGRFFQGSIDEVIVYEHGLTAAEVAELYARYLSQ